MLTALIGLPATRPSSCDSVDELLERAGRGDEVAFAQLYDRLAPRVLGLASRILVNRALAEETAQEVFLEVWRKAGSFDRTRGAAQAWILTIAHHRAVDRVRAQQSASDRELDAGLQSLEVDRDVVADAVDDGDRARAVHAAMDRLTDVQRTVLRLAYFGGYTQTEISDLTRTPLGTVKTRMRDALTRLRTELAGTGPAPVTPPGTGAVPRAGRRPPTRRAARPPSPLRGH